MLEPCNNSGFAGSAATQGGLGEGSFFNASVEGGFVWLKEE